MKHKIQETMEILPYGPIFDSAETLEIPDAKTQFMELADKDLHSLSEFIIGLIYFDRLELVKWMLDLTWPDAIWSDDFHDALVQTCFQVHEFESAKLAWDKLELNNWA